MATHLQRPRAVVRRGRLLGGPNRGRKRWWRRERRPPGKLVQQRSPRRNRDLQAHPPSNTLLGDGLDVEETATLAGARSKWKWKPETAKEKHAEKVRRETRRRRGRDGSERKSRHGPRLNGVALAPWECRTETDREDLTPLVDWTALNEQSRKTKLLKRKVLLLQKSSVPT